MAKEGYSNKGYISYHGEPLGSATKSKGNCMAPAKGPVVSNDKNTDLQQYHGTPLGSATKGKR